MKLLRNAIGAGFLSIAAPACAQSLANGEPLQFNYEYHCNGERVIVGHCRDNNPGSYCQVYYPDRTSLHPPIQVQKAEQLGQVIAKLSACASGSNARTASRESSEPVRGRPASIGSSAGSNTARTVPRLKAPGLGKMPWQLLNINYAVGIFFTKAAINRRETLPEGWFTEVFTDDQNIGPLSGVEFLQTRYRVNCTDQTVEILQYAAYNLHAKLLKAGSTSSPEFTPIKPNTDQSQILGFLCGTGKAKITDSFVGDGIQLFGLYVELQKTRAEAQQGQ